MTTKVTESVLLNDIIFICKSSMNDEWVMNYFSGKYVVLFFYPLDFTFVCPTEIIAFSERVAEFEALGCAVVACSTDSHFSHLAWCEKVGDISI